jgi:WD40 repeat protein
VSICEHLTAQTYDPLFVVSQIHREGNQFSTASEDNSCKIFDVRADQELVTLGASGCKYSSVALSTSCRLLLAGGEDGKIHMFDVLRGTESGKESQHFRIRQSLN